MNASSTWEILLTAQRQRSASSKGVVPEHRPIAAVLSCSDARVCPEYIFDQPPGKLFVVRVAGNGVTAEALASIDYATQVLGVELVIVMGHTNCGAAAAAMSGESAEFLKPLVAPLSKLVESSANPDELAESNVAAMASTLANADSPVGSLVRSGRVRIVGAIYDLAHNQVKSIDFLN